MTYVPKSKRGKSQEHKYSGKFGLETIEAVVNLECKGCAKQIKKLNQYVQQGRTGAFVTLVKDGAVYHITEVKREYP